ncbi:MAG: TPM domain-containing protein [Chloroflexi bacterium]|nr:TPM domain-containing protein [Chloroflexota bacterium]
MTRLLFFMAILAALAVAPLNALAATYIQDNGNMFSANAKSQATQQIDQLVQSTKKEVLVYTVTSLNGQDPSTAADSIFRQNGTNGVLLFMSKNDRQLQIKIGTDTRQAISTQRETQIRDAILTDFRSGDFDKGLLDGVGAIRATLTNAPLPGSGSAVPVRQSGPNVGLIVLLIVLALVAVWVIAGIRRARQQPYFSYGQNPPPGGYGAPGYGYGPGPGYGGGGGFFSGMLGGLGGALLGNALFDAFRPRDRFYDNPGTGPGGFQDQGWQGSDAGQVSDSSADGGSWGDGGGADSGGGFDSGGGDPGGGSW